MSKKLKIVIALAVGIVILSLGSGAIVMASTGTTTTTTVTTTTAQCNGTVGNGLYSAVATTLGVTEQQVADAFQQAAVQAQ